MRGVSSGKEEVHQATRNLDKGVFPTAFCRIYPDYLGGSPEYVNIMHADGAGTKSALAYLYWKETGDLSVWRGIAQDAIVMNLDDLICTGAVDEFLFTSTIGRNKNGIPGEVITEIIRGTEVFFDKMREFGIQIHYMGGETADLGDLVRTVIVDGNLACRMPLKQVITNEGIRVGDLIVGLASSGMTSYETEYNSGIGSNGLTSARHDLLDHEYAVKYPETLDPGMEGKWAYSGKYRLTDPSGTPANIGKLLLSPTRSYAPVIRTILDGNPGEIHGMVHCSGGGQTKCLHYIPEGVSIVKDSLFPIPPVFRLIQESSQVSWREMYQVFNMGHRLELFTHPAFAAHIITVSQRFGLEAQIIGRVVSRQDTRLLILGPEGEYPFPDLPA